MRHDVLGHYSSKITVMLHVALEEFAAVIDEDFDFPTQ